MSNPCVQAGPPRSSFPEFCLGRLLNIPKDGDYTSSLGNLCQYSVTLTVKVLFCHIQRESHVFQPFTPMCPRAHCWLIFNFVPTKTPRSFSTKFFQPGHLLSLYWYRGSFLLRSRTLWGSWQFISTDCWGLSGWQQDHLLYQPLLPV